MEKLICKSENDLSRIYQTEQGFEVRYNYLSDGDPVYLYKTLRGAKVAMQRMNAGRYQGCKPSCKWE